MYPFIKTSREFAEKYLAVCIRILCVLMIVWLVVLGVELQTNSAIIVKNTQQVLNDANAIKVKHINTKGSLYLEDGSKVEDSEVNGYIRTAIGSGTYYINDSKLMSAEISRSEAWQLGRVYLIVNAFVYVMFLCLVVNYKRVWLCVFYLGITVVNLVILKYYFIHILLSSFAISWICVGLFLILFYVNCSFNYTQYR